MQEPLAGDVVVVRRKNAWEHDEHPHGVWKIAYADFMTAMMAFFLVMWLINVTDDSVRRGVAQYFNPVKLASTAPNQKGLNDPSINGPTNEAGSGQQVGDLAPPVREGDRPDAMGNLKVATDPATGGGGGEDRTGQFTQVHSETQIFIDPYAVLDRLAQKAHMRDADEMGQSAIGSGLDKEAGAKGGEAYRDPFDPLYWQFVPNRGIEEANRVEPLQQTRNIEIDTDLASGGIGESQTADGLVRAAQENGQDGSSKTEAAENAEMAGTPGEASETAQDGSAGSAQPAGHGGDVTQQQAAREMPQNGEVPETAGNDNTTVRQIETELAAAKGTSLEQTAARVNVRQTAQGVLLSLTDDQSFEMFAIGSAEPRAELVALLEKLGKILAEKPGQIIIKGHTDARPFRSRTYDNWKLSTARAHMALYMLTRGGVEQGRFGRVEGYADRELKDAGNPNGAVNRRVEILLLEPEQ
ncbi:MotB family protein [Roseibium sp. RKSG952]|uniref:MotB family protein n=1 Tax=Roseibium sp. RKSG952 TaxID=2529384 RepID=UPI0012BC90B8|nr:MotB family protein [Roseibium sp. RKSG952]MTH98288.1 MotB family protein [Roseibium sp. RKSG952]